MEPLIEGRILIDGGESYRSRNTGRLKPDYVLTTNGGKYLAVVEAKNMEHSISDGIQQSKNYASILDVPFAFSSNGTGFYEFDFNTGLTRELPMDDFPSEEELLERMEAGCGIGKDSAVLYPESSGLYGYIMKGRFSPLRALRARIGRRSPSQSSMAVSDGHNPD